MVVSGASPMLVPTDDPVTKIVVAVIVVAFVLVCFIGLVTLLAAVLSRNTQHTRLLLAAMPIRVLVAGALAYALFMSLAYWLYSQAVTVRLLETEVSPGMLGAAIAAAAIPLLASLLGAPGTLARIGDLLASFSGSKMTGLRRLVLATIVAALASMLPVIGWFVVLPALLAATSGAWLLGMVYWKRRA